MSGFPVATAADRAAKVLEGPGAVIVDFFTPHCVPCRKLEPMLQAVAQGLSAGLRVVKVDASVSTDLAQEYRVRGVPCLLLFKDGSLLDRKSGFVAATQLREWVRPYVKGGADDAHGQHA